MFSWMTVNVHGKGAEAWILQHVCQVLQNCCFYKTLIDQNFVWFKQRQMSLDKLRFRKSHRRFSIECRAIALVLILVLILIRFEIGWVEVIGLTLVLGQLVENFSS